MMRFSMQKMNHNLRIELVQSLSTFSLHVRMKKHLLINEDFIPDERMNAPCYLVNTPWSNPLPQVFHKRRLCLAKSIYL